MSCQLSNLGRCGGGRRLAAAPRPAREAKRSLVGLALNWVLHHSPADCLILGASKLPHLQENLSAIEEGPLPADAVAACDRVWGGLRGTGSEIQSVRRFSR